MTSLTTASSAKASSKPDCLYLINGKDELRKQDLQARLVERLSQAGEINLVTFNAAELGDANDVVNILNSYSLGGEKQVVVLQNADKLLKASCDILVNYIDNPNPDATLLLTATALKANSALYKAVFNHSQTSIISATAPKKWELPQFVSKLARSHGLTIDKAATTYLIDSIGEDTAELEQAMIKIAAWANSNSSPLSDNKGKDDKQVLQIQKIDLAVAKMLIARQTALSPFDMINLFNSQNNFAFVQELQQYPESELIGLFIMLYRHIQKLRRYQDLRGLSAKEAAAELGYKSDWQLKNVSGAAEKFSADYLETLLVKAADVDKALKTGANNRYTIQNWLFGSLD